MNKKRNIQNIIDNDDEIGEVAEWAGVSAAQAKDDDDFDVENKQVFNSQDHVEIARQKINQKLSQKGTNLSRRNGPLVNNLKDKAKMLALQNNSTDIERNQSVQQVEVRSPVKESPEKRNSHKSIDAEFDQANQNRLIELQKAKTEIKLIGFIEALDQLKGSQDVRDSIQFIEKKTSFFDKLFGCFNVHLKSTSLMQEKNQVCMMSQISFDDSNDQHFRILYSIYCQLMNTDHCLRYGSHWELIGFQGNDPATDLRGAGILGLVQILAFISEYKIYIQHCLKVISQLQIPFSITLINITTFVLVSLKDNKLNEMINKEYSVISVVNKLYFAGFNLLLKTLRKETIAFHTIGNQLTYVRKQIHEHPQKLIRDFNQDIQKFYKTNNI